MTEGDGGGPRFDERAGGQPAGDLPTVAQGSGDAALAAAAERAISTREKNLTDLDPLPIPADTANVRQGPELNPACLSLLPLVGVWRGTGQYGNGPREEGPHFGQQLVVSHDGRDFLRYESVTWLLDEQGDVAEPASASSASCARSPTARSSC